MERTYVGIAAQERSSFYRAVEATSVTPFSPRAIDRGIAAITVALVRLGHAKMTAPPHAIEILQYRKELDFVVDAIALFVTSQFATQIYTAYRYPNICINES